MRRLFLLILSLLVISTSLFAKDKEGWNTEKSTHFIVCYKKAPADFVHSLIEKSEDYYNQIADSLNFRRFNFWLWEDRAVIYVYDDHADYQTSTGEPAWSAGRAMASRKTIETFPYAEGFLETTLPHEMSHIIFRELVGLYNPAIPLWLDEGVASFQEHERYISARQTLKAAIEQGTFLSLESLQNIQSLDMLDKKSVYLFYIEAFSIIDYLINTLGRDKFVLFCQYLRDKKDLGIALSGAYSFSTLKELDILWQEYLKK